MSFEFRKLLMNHFVKFYPSIDRIFILTNIREIRSGRISHYVFIHVESNICPYTQQHIHIFAAIDRQRDKSIRLA